LQSALRDLTGWSYGDYWFPEVRSLGGAAAMLTMVLYPYVYLLARAAFLEQSVCALEVSRTLGCTAWRSFFRVALPLARPAIVAGTALALMETLADFGTVSFFGIPTFTTGIVRAWVSFGDPVSAAQLSSSLLALVFIVLLAEHGSRRRSRYYHTSSKYQHLPGYRLHGARRVLAIVACALPLFFGFLLPAAILLKSSLETLATEADGRFFGLVWNSVTLAITTAVLAVALATLLAYSLRLNPSPVSRLAARLASMGYAVPGTVIAVGVLIPFAAFDNWLDALFERLFGLSTGLLGQADHGRRRQGAGHRTDRSLAPGAHPDHANQPLDRRSGRLRRCDERAAGHLGHAALQLRHAGGAGSQPGLRRAVVRGRLAVAGHRCRGHTTAHFTVEGHRQRATGKP
jgi:iron(III) transport system permease protein